MTETNARVKLEGLHIHVGRRALVQDVSLHLEAGRILGLVGASGSGKTLTARSLLGMVDLAPGVVAAQLEIQVGDQRWTPYEGCLAKNARCRTRAFAPVRGEVVGYLPQHARASLDPVAKVGPQVRWAATLGRPVEQQQPEPWLERAGFRDASRVARLYPHELSGGMAQRVSIALALARGSRFLLADEPTTGLDPTVQRDILTELVRLRSEGMGVLLITHDLRILQDVADEVVVMDQGTVAERTTAADLAQGKLSSEPARRLFEATQRVDPGGHP